ncbi:MAG: hypothetical protein CMQ41_11515, partial [Gammaproteobacteria bacterium]|nr:hypothetical protein [Gammaproteobacteria bacterium]
MAASTLKRRKISWGSHSPKEKLNLLKRLTISGEPDDFLDILAGIEDIGIATKQLIDICLNASPEIKKLTALRTKSKSIAEAIIPTIQDLDCLIDLVCNGASIHIRKNAVIGIDDIDTLTNLYQRLDGADKTVCKVLKEKLGEASIKQSSIQVMTKPTVKKNEDESSSQTSTNQRVYLNEIVHFKQELKKQSIKKIASLDKLQNDINEL